jgi:competence protein ComEC
LEKVSKRWQLRETLAQTLSTQVTVIPLLIYMSGDVSIVSLPANILILLVVPITMLVGFIAILTAFMSSVLAWPLAYISYLLLSWILFISHLFGSLSFATIKIPGVTFLTVALIYVLYVIAYARKSAGDWILLPLQARSERGRE